MKQEEEDLVEITDLATGELTAAERCLKCAEEWFQRKARRPRLLLVEATIVLVFILLFMLRSVLPVAKLPITASPSLNDLFTTASEGIPGETLVISPNGVLSAVHQGTGTVAWRYKEARGIWGKPSVMRGTIFLNTQSGHVVALAAATGKVIWSYAKRFSAASLLQIGNGIVFIRDQDLRSSGGSVIALRQYDGSMLWQQSTFHFSQFVQDESAGVAYIGDAEGRITAVRISSGTFLWGEHTRAWNWITANGTVVYLATWDGYIAALHAQSGVPLWHTRLRIGASGAPLIGGENIVLPTTDGGLSDIDAGTGLTRWSRQGEEPLMVTQGVVYSPASDGRMAVLRASSGRLLRSYQDIESALPSDESGEIFAVSANSLIAFQAQNGAIRWRLLSPAPIEALCPTRSLLYVSTRGDGVLALPTTCATRL